MQHPFLVYNQDFTLFGRQHWLVLVLLLLIGWLLPLLARRYANARQQLQIAQGFALLLSLTVISWTAIRIGLGDFDATTDLPLDICNILAFLMPVLMWRPTFKVFEVIVFWVLLGTMIALFTPHLFNGFPNFTFFKYWIVHGGLVIYVVYITRVFRFAPQKSSVWKSFRYLQGYVLFVLVCNLLLGANYVYILGPPPTASPIDFLGPWPWYLLVIEGIALVAFWGIYLLFRSWKVPAASAGGKAVGG